MNTKYIAYLILIFVVIMSVVSCNDDNTTTYTEVTPSKNALINSFSVSGTPRDALDSITYPVLESTKFAIDHINGLIYNPDSLAYGTRLGKFKATISLADAAAKIDLDYGDTIYTWNSAEGDSIDFSKNLTLKVVPQAGSGFVKSYTVRFNIHQYDPDTLNWTRVASLPVAANIPLKAIALDDNIVVYALEGNKINAYMSSLDNVSWSVSSTVLPSDLRLANITVFKDNIFAVARDGSTYKASTSNPTSWEVVSNGFKMHNLLGILPATVEADDQLLVAVNDNEQYKLGKTKDMSNISFVEEIVGFSDALLPVDEKFPSHDFSSSTNYDRINLVENYLVVSGGVDFKGNNIADVWLINVNKNNVLEMSPLYYGITHRPFDVANDFKTFVYDEKLYAATGDILYTSKWGIKWEEAPQKQMFASGIKTAKNQSIVIDSKNYVWIVGAKDQAGRVWKGRLNRLAPKN